MHHHQCRWCRVAIVEHTGTVVADVELSGPRPPDLAAVDLVAHLALFARRRGAVGKLRDVSVPMAELLELAALPVEVQRSLPVEAQGELPVELEREAKGRKEPLGVEELEEEAHLGDLAP